MYNNLIINNDTPQFAGLNEVRTKKKRKQAKTKGGKSNLSPRSQAHKQGTGRMRSINSLWTRHSHKYSGSRWVYQQCFLLTEHANTALNGMAIGTSQLLAFQRLFCAYINRQGFCIMRYSLVHGILKTWTRWRCSTCVFCFLLGPEMIVIHAHNGLRVRGVRQAVASEVFFSASPNLGPRADSERRALQSGLRI